MRYIRNILQQAEKSQTFMVTLKMLYKGAFFSVEEWLRLAGIHQANTTLCTQAYILFLYKLLKILRTLPAHQTLLSKYHKKKELVIGMELVNKMVQALTKRKSFIPSGIGCSTQLSLRCSFNFFCKAWKSNTTFPVMAQPITKIISDSAFILNCKSNRKILTPHSRAIICLSLFFCLVHLRRCIPACASKMCNKITYLKILINAVRKSYERYLIRIDF